VLIRTPLCSVVDRVHLLMFEAARTDGRFTDAPSLGVYA
jgi:hypothetical protein